MSQTTTPCQISERRAIAECLAQYPVLFEQPARLVMRWQRLQRLQSGLYYQRQDHLQMSVNVQQGLTDHNSHFLFPASPAESPSLPRTSRRGSKPSSVTHALAKLSDCSDSPDVSRNGTQCR